MHFSISYFYEARFVLLQHPSPWTFPFRIHFSPLRFSLIKYLLILLSYPYSLPFSFMKNYRFTLEVMDFHRTSENIFLSIDLFLSPFFLERITHSDGKISKYPGSDISIVWHRQITQREDRIRKSRRLIRLSIDGRFVFSSDCVARISHFSKWSSLRSEWIYRFDPFLLFLEFFFHGSLPED